MEGLQNVEPIGWFSFSFREAWQVRMSLGVYGIMGRLQNVGPIAWFPVLYWQACQYRGLWNSCRVIKHWTHWEAKFFPFWYRLSLLGSQLLGKTSMVNLELFLVRLGTGVDLSQAFRLADTKDPTLESNRCLIIYWVGFLVIMVIYYIASCFIIAK